MSEEKPRLARLTSILTDLQSTGLVTARSLAERYGVSLRTIYRDIKTLEQSGVPITTDEGRGYRLLAGFRLPPVMFTEAEANALITAEKLMATNKDASLAKAYQDAVVKIRAVLPASARAEAEILVNRIQSRDNPGQRGTSALLIDFQRAITKRTLVNIVYQDNNNNLSTRTIEPFALYTVDGNWVGVAFCRLREDYRAFRLDRIKTFRPLAKVFGKHDISLEEYFERSYRKFIPTLDIPLSQPTKNFTPSTKTTTMVKLSVAPFNLIGISVRTSNVNPAQTARDIGALWQRLMAEQLIAQIPNKVDSTLYLAYTDFESDFTGAYTAVLGCKVSSLNNLPEGFEGYAVAGGEYKKIVRRGNLSQGLVYLAWKEVWDSGMDRAYTTDFEVYGPKAMNPEDAEVEIYIAV